MRIFINSRCAAGNISIAFTITLLHSDAHEITGIAAVIRDETAQFMQIKGLKQRIIELEKNAAT